MSLPIIQPHELKLVEKPAQYLGAEVGSIVKKDSEVEINFCLAFPDSYEVGMSHVGFQILYDLLNRDPKIWAERVYVPLEDMEKLLRKKNAPLRALESQRPLADFDIVGFSLQYELCFTGILSILDLGKIPLLATDRTEQHPLIIAGGPVAYHPEPFADFIDCFLVGDGEELVLEFTEACRQSKISGDSRELLLKRLSKIQGVYIPKFFEPEYSSDGIFRGLKPLLPGYTSVRRRIIATLEGAPYPEKPVVPNIKAVHDRLSVEVMRGCVRGCRFCQAGYLYRPQRERTPEDILKIVENSLQNTGYEELSLLSLSTADYCSILPLLSVLKERYAENDNLAISFPSTRVDALKPELLQEVQSIRRSGFTIAPEAGTQRLRDVINKGVTEEQLFETCRNVFKLGWSSVKMYFMIGLPTETDEDLLAIAELGKKVKQIAGRGRDITVSVSTHVPKPHTPFQWAEQISEGETVRRQHLIANALYRTGVNFRYHDSYSSFLEGIFCRGDRKLSALVVKAYQLGARFDGWVEKINSDIWNKVFSEAGITPEQYLDQRQTDAALPWDHISCDIPKSYFLKEWQRATAARLTPDCLTESCSICGACDYDAARNVLHDRKRSESLLKIVNPPWQKIIDQRAQGQTENLLQPLQTAATCSTAAPEPEGKYSLREYLRTETAAAPKPQERTVVPIIQRLRLCYEKQGVAAYSAHLELMSIFFRSARRCKLPLAFSRGFNPKPKISFGPPLQLGLTSSCEYLDFYLTEKMDPDQLILKLNQTLPAGLKAISAVEITFEQDSIQKLIVAQSFEAKVDPAIAVDPEFKNKLALALSNWRDISFARIRKHRQQQSQLKDSVLSLSQINQGLLRFTIDYRGERAVKPLEVITALTGLESVALEIKKIAVEFESIAA